MPTIRVGVLRGGPSSEYDVSLNTGREVLANLNKDKYTPIDIFIDQSGIWYLSGLAVSPIQASKQVDVFWNALHGEYGEDGTVQNILESTRVPYTGSTQFSSALAMNKHLTKELIKKHGIKTPGHLTIEYGDSVGDVTGIIFNKFSPPWIVKPAGMGSSVGLFLALTLDELAQSIENCFKICDKVMVEEFITGKEATCGVIENFRNQELYSLPIVEIRKPKNKKVFDYEAKYGGITEEICPGCFSDIEKFEIESTAKEIHKLLNLRHYSRTDFIVNNRGIYILEANTLPGLTQESLMPKALKSVGCSYTDFLDHIITQALNN